MSVFVASEVPWNRIWHFNFEETETKKVGILAETYINLDQIHHIRNNWLGPIFFSLGDSHTKGLLVLLHLCLEDVNEVDTDPKGRFVSFKVTLSNDKVLCVYTLTIAPGNSCLEGVSLETLNVLWIKWRGMVELKHFINTISIMLCQNPLWIIDWRIYEEERIKIRLSSPTTIDLLALDLR